MQRDGQPRWNFRPGCESFRRFFSFKRRSHDSLFLVPELKKSGDRHDDRARGVQNQISHGVFQCFMSYQRFLRPSRSWTPDKSACLFQKDLRRCIPEFPRSHRPPGRNKKQKRQQNEYSAQVEHPDRFELNSLTAKTEQSSRRD